MNLNPADLLIPIFNALDRLIEDEAKVEFSESNFVFPNGNIAALFYPFKPRLFPFGNNLLDSV